MARLWSFSVLLAGFLLLQTDGVRAGDDEFLGSPFIQRAVREAIDLVDNAYKETRIIQKERLSKRTLKASDLLRFFKHPMAETRVAVRSAEYMENALRLIQQHVHRVHKRSLNATDLLSPSDLDAIARVTGCLAVRQPPLCKDDCFTDRYRTFTSVCNNRRKPRLGSSNIALTRWLPPRYEDGFSLPLGWTPGRRISGAVLPLVREVSNRILRTPNEDVVMDTEISHMLMQWGQWVDHDMSLSPHSGSIQTFNDGIDCERTCVQRNPCFPIRIPPNDTRITDPDTCLPFFRSAPACGTGELGSLFGDFNTRQQINALTSFIDVNEVYGSTDCLANKLRNLTNELGLLLVNEEFSDNGREYLPFNTISSNLCGSMGESCFTSENSTPCFIAGDVRVNEQLGVLTMHTLFLREHNRLARELKTLNPHWSGETTYQEARKILGAFQQIINHRDFAPLVLGEEAMEKFLPEYEGYDESIDPGIANVFATAVFRFGHLIINPLLFRLNESYQEHPQFKSIDLHQAFFTPWRLIREGGVDPLVRGLVGRPAKMQTQGMMMHDELRERLFELTSRLGMDLGSLNMQRSRDHGLPGYNAWRRFCGLSAPRSRPQLGRVLRNQTLARELIRLYRTPDNIDVWLGGISEPFVKGGRVGPLFACLIGQQFKNLRDGDRFWWENAEVFPGHQRQALKQVSLSRIICDNTGIQVVPRNAFKFHPFPIGYVNCTEIPQVDLSAWREDVKVTPCGSVPVIEHGHFSICQSSVRYSCESGFKLVGGDTITCLSNGQWNREPPGCADLHKFYETPGPTELSGLGGEREISAFSVELQTANQENNTPFPCAREIYNEQRLFNCQTGIFTCQTPGSYLFSYHCEVNNQAVIALQRNNVTEATSDLRVRSRQTIASGSVILQLDIGDQVWLETKQGRIVPSSYFLGHLLD
ncbi:eosinophil peroxidase-like [Stegostoma tigrinum]|uniref:eosinophil peroxidase-like n=1 Tax=Stegostoma tigrinum TaxID=3053191 RepID=UPI00286FF63A|nr:eosinophil peroxidase-like [Stegostoma tigrinum]